MAESVCEHLKDKNLREIYELLFGFYVALLHEDSRKRKVSDCKCKECGKKGNRIHACLSCIYFACFDHIKEHLKKGCKFAMELQFGNVFCIECLDYVYDDALEKIKESNTIAYHIQNGFNRYPEEIREVKISKLIVNYKQNCFLNCVLRSLFLAPSLYDYFFHPGYKCSLCDLCEDYSDKECFECLLCDEFVEFFSGSAEMHQPSYCLYYLKKMKASLRGNDQQDASETYTAIIDLLRKSLGLPHKHSFPTKAGDPLQELEEEFHCNEYLEEEFHCNEYLMRGQRTALAEKLSLSDSEIKIWFHKQRMKKHKLTHSMQLHDNTLLETVFIGEVKFSTTDSKNLPGVDENGEFEIIRLSFVNSSNIESPSFNNSTEDKKDQLPRLSASTHENNGGVSAANKEESKAVEGSKRNVNPGSHNRRGKGGNTDSPRRRRRRIIQKFNTQPQVTGEVKKCSEEKITHKLSTLIENFLKRQDKTDEKNQNQFKRLPIILVFSLERNVGKYKITDLADFPEFLDMSKYVCENAKKENCFYCRYYLYAIHLHCGNPEEGGHYLVYCKEFTTNRWYKYNEKAGGEGEVELVDTSQVLCLPADLLFYHRECYKLWR